MTYPSFELRELALLCLLETDAAKKAARVFALAHDWAAGTLSLDTHAQLAAPSEIPGRPDKPDLVLPKELAHRSMVTAEGRATLIHAMTHIEFNAINLALDALWRFADMPAAYYTDWLRVAHEEAQHFSMLAAHLHMLGYQYGDFPAHNSLWEMAHKTRDDVLARIALVPRTMEARGLDATPKVRAKLAQAGDQKAAEIMDIILREEVGHVLVGNRWYGYLCALRGQEPIATYAQLASKYAAPVLRGPFNLAARKAAGFSDAELAALSVDNT
ncbi:MAG: ferritin-like domain-containing protein [Gallionella sp.]